MSPITRLMRAIVLSAALIVPAVAVAVPASAAATTCPVVYWGSVTKTATGSGPAESLTEVRTGRHACFDRVVFDIGGSGPVEYHVSYVDNVYTEGEGKLVPLAGGAKLQIVVHAPAYDEDGNPTYDGVPPNVGGFRTFRQLAWLGSFEGQTSFGLGVRATLPMRVLVLSGPGDAHRVVVDVAHRWGAF
jgi:hypothetical protein